MVVVNAFSRAPKPVYRGSCRYSDHRSGGFCGRSYWKSSSNQLQRIKEEQMNDHELKCVTEFTLQGWPDILGKEFLSPYWAARSYLSVVDSLLLLYNKRIVIPKALRSEILHRIYSDGHLCLNKCRRRAHDSIWWPNLGLELRALVQNCSFCITHSNQQRAEHLKPTFLPERPWFKIEVA